MKSFLLAATILSVVGVTTASQAAVVTHTFDTQVTSPSSTPSGSPVVTFNDGGGSGSVTMTIDLGPLSSPEYISDYWFNFADAGSTSLSIARTGGTGPASTWIAISPIVADGYNSAGPNGLFDGLISFSTSNAGAGIRRFNFDETLVFTLTGTGITATDFDVFSTVGGGGSDSQLGQMHIQGIGINGTGSAHVSPGPTEVPEPTTLGLLGVGLLGLAAAARRRRTDQKS